MTARSARTAALLAALTVLPAGPRTAEAEASQASAAPARRLAVSFFTVDFLSEVQARIEAERLETERLTEAYLQEEAGLIWAAADNGLDVDWYDADDYCRELELGDWTDWRLPTIDELEGLHDRRSEATYKLPAAVRLTGCCPWSSTRSGESSAWNFSFRYRKRFSGSMNYSYALRALCVRAAAEADLLFYERAAEEAEEEAKRRRRGS